MMPSKTSCMPSLEKVDMMYGKNGGTSLHHEFHYELICTGLERIRSSLPMWWLLTLRGKWWLQMSLVDQ